MKSLLALFAITLICAFSVAEAQQCRCRKTPQILDASYSKFTLKPDDAFTCSRRDPIDLNTGRDPREAVRRLYCQITGKEPPAVAADYAERLEKDPNMRRIDVALHICNDVGRLCDFVYPSPWERNLSLSLPECERRSARDVGAVLMFFFDCPGRTNCEKHWANNHVYGMDAATLMNGGGFYDPDDSEFWTQELRDAKYAGLQFLLPNVYGPDMIDEGKIDVLARVLDKESNPVKIGLFDDTWTWGQPHFGEKWEAVPSLSDTESAAQTLYSMKWKPFFNKISDEYRYKIDGRPAIYFYNAGTLTPRTASAAVIARMKEMFAADFGVVPFVVVDTAFFDDPAMPQVADGRFTWNSLEPKAPNGVNAFTLSGVTTASAMTRWDSVGRDYPERAAIASDLVVKGDELLKKALEASQSSDVLMLATWNDLGEGTGLNRAFDYYYKGDWLAPDHFMRIIRNAQCSN